MKIKGFLKDVGGASRVTKARLEAFANASAVPEKVDPIGDVAREWHPGKLDLVVTDVRSASKTAKTVRFERADGGKLPFFYAGQFMVLDFEIGQSVISRPYSISSAPFEARQAQGFVEITVRRSKGDGFICDYINDSVKVGDTFTGLIGCGQFYYEPLRDAKHVVALAGGVGITPFRLHGAGNRPRHTGHGSDDPLRLRLLRRYRHESGAGRDQERQGAYRPRPLRRRAGLAGREGLPDRRADPEVLRAGHHLLHLRPPGDVPLPEGELAKLDVPQPPVRFEVFGQAKDITAFPGYPAGMKDKTFQLTVVRGIHEDVIPAKATESLVVALERAGIRIETGCRSGECGFCRTKVLSGSVYICPESDGRRAADKDFGYVHACAAYPVSDVTIKIPIE